MRISICLIVALFLSTVTLSFVASLGAGVICNHIRGLTVRQREICSQHPDVIAIIGEGASLSQVECRHQFRNQRWNCQSTNDNGLFGASPVKGSKENSFVASINSAGVGYAIARACRSGNLSSCGCAKQREEYVYRKRRMIDFEELQEQSQITMESSMGSKEWNWKGCQQEGLAFGLRFTRLFINAADEVYNHPSSTVNRHNYRVGRKALRNTLRFLCKCHGVSGSCTTRTCWKNLPSFRHVGNHLYGKYLRARQVIFSNKTTQLKLRLKRPRRSANGVHKLQPRAGEMVYLRKSPSYCDFNPELGIIGTHGRLCNRTLRGMHGCELLCCGRGYNTHQVSKTWQCKCVFKWCCRVACETCSSVDDEYRCK